MIKAVLFDLDDTLVIADNDALMGEYFTRLATRYSGVVEPTQFQRQLVKSTLAVIANSNSETTFLDRFSDDFFGHLGIVADMKPFEEFYTNEYAQLGRWAHPAPGARAAVESAQNLGLKIALATNPVFPRIAIEKRLQWAQIDDIAWDLVTTGEEMHFCKPHPDYFRETASKLGVQPELCLMVGNDPENDLPAAQSDMLTFLVTGTGDAKNEALQAFTNSNASARTSVKEDYQGTLLQLPELLTRLVSL